MKPNQTKAIPNFINKHNHERIKVEFVAYIVYQLYCFRLYYNNITLKQDVGVVGLVGVARLCDSSDTHHRHHHRLVLGLPGTPRPSLLHRPAPASSADNPAESAAASSSESAAVSSESAAESAAAATSAESAAAVSAVAESAAVTAENQCRVAKLRRSKGTEDNINMIRNFLYNKELLK